MRCVVAAIADLLERRGGARYCGEPVTQRAHALQCAWFARTDGASDALIVAALLHDVGHLVHEPGERVADQGTDARHECAGQAWLAQYFGLEVTEPVRLHVDAKRYLCGRDPSYEGSLSPASRQSLALQGGPFARRDLGAFATQPFAMDAVRLRRWDDGAKRPGRLVPGLEHYEALLLGVASRHGRSPGNAPGAE